MHGLDHETRVRSDETEGRGVGVEVHLGDKEIDTVEMMIDGEMTSVAIAIEIVGIMIAVAGVEEIAHLRA